VLANPADAAGCGQRLRERAMNNFLLAQAVAATIAFYRCIG